MREVNIGGKTVGLKATPLAQLYYKQEFNVDLIGDLMRMRNLEEDPEKLDAILILQLTWAMAKANIDFGKPFPSFPAWLSSFDYIDWANIDMINGILEEAQDGFFRSAGAG